MKTSSPSPASPTRTAAQAEASRRNGSLGRGPITPGGRTRAAQNGLLHGLRSEELTVLPHERPDEVVEHVERVLADLAVESYTEVMVGKRVALRLLQQRRLDDVEARRLSARGGRRLDDTEEVKTRRLVEGAVMALATMTSVMSTTAPVEREALDQILVPISAVMDMLERVEGTSPKVFVGRTALQAALTKLKESSPVDTDLAAYGVVLDVARAALAAVELLLPGARSAVEAKRVEVVDQMPLPDDRDALLRRRYATDLDRRLAADMQLLAALRNQRDARESSGSLGQPPQVQVRLVR